jgi:hypothetical protein
MRTCPRVGCRVRLQAADRGQESKSPFQRGQSIAVAEASVSLLAAYDARPLR